ncbi:MAG: hypothetical protein WD077_02355 [Bacteroidia bacterium]
MKDIDLLHLAITVGSAAFTVLFFFVRTRGAKFLSGVFLATTVGLGLITMQKLMWSDGDHKEVCIEDGERYEDNDLGEAASESTIEVRERLTAEFLTPGRLEGNERHAAFLAKPLIDGIFLRHPRANGIMMYAGYIDGEGLVIHCEPSIQHNIVVHEALFNATSVKLTGYCPFNCVNVRPLGY